MKTNSLGRETLILTSSKFVALLISMLSAMLLSRFRTLEEYGIYSQLLMVVNLVSSLLMLGLPNSVNYFLARAKTKEETRGFLSVYYTLSTLLSAIVGTVLVLATPLIVTYFKNPAISGFTYFLAVYPWTRIIMSGIENVLIVSGKIKLLMVYRILNSFALLLAIVFVQFANLQFKHYMLLYVIIESLFSIWVYFIANNIANRLFLSFDKAMVKAIFKFSIPIGLASMVGTISIELDKLVIGKFMDTESLAIYANAGRELPITIISASITAVLMPKVVRLLRDKRTKEAIKLWGDATTISYTIICFFSAAMIVFAPQVITILFSQKYLPGVNVFRVYNLVLLFRATYFAMILSSIGKTKFIMYSSIASLVLNLILNVLCLKTLGFVGPAIATLLSISIVAVCQLWFTAKEIRINFQNIFPWKTLGAITVINFLMGMIFVGVVGFLKLSCSWEDILIAFILGVVWMVIYGLVCLRIIKEKWKSLNV